MNNREILSKYFDSPAFRIEVPCNKDFGVRLEKLAKENLSSSKAWKKKKNEGARIKVRS